MKNNARVFFHCFLFLDELVQGALNDDAYQKYFAGIDSEVLLENFRKICTRFK